ncbi:MAG: signal peptidase I [bacterium]|nr:signal peptidase I [bacterium]
MNKKSLIENAKSLALFITIALLLRVSVVEAYKIPSSSMESTLLIGDHLLVSKLSYGLRIPFMEESPWIFDTPKRGDIVVFTKPDDPLTEEDESDTNVIKRVIGIPGDEVEVRGKAVIVNGKVLEEKYAQWKYGGRVDFGPETIPENHVLLMGDNRDESFDGRLWTLAGKKAPFLDIARIKGRALVIYWNAQHLTRIFSTIH